MNYLLPSRIPVEGEKRNAAKKGKNSNDNSCTTSSVTMRGVKGRQGGPSFLLQLARVIGYSFALNLAAPKA